jgi:hypothetical protein
MEHLCHGLLRCNSVPIVAASPCSSPVRVTVGPRRRLPPRTSLAVARRNTTAVTAAVGGQSGSDMVPPIWCVGLVIGDGRRHLMRSQDLEVDD